MPKNAAWLMAWGCDRAARTAVVVVLAADAPERLLFKARWRVT
jgi:hypothetical protein